MLPDQPPGGALGRGITVPVARVGLLSPGARNTSSAPAGRLQRQVLTAVLSAMVAFQGALLADESPFWLVLWTVVSAAITLIAAVWVRRRTWSESVISTAGLAGFAAPFVLEAGRRIAGTPVHPWEVVLIAGVLTLAVVLAVFARDPRVQPLAMVAALFALLFAGSLSTNVVTVASGAVFAISGVIWLAERHWGLFARSGQRLTRRQYPLRTLAVAAAVILVPLLAIGYTQKDRLWSLTGFAPTSGGEGDRDDTARQGVGDGEALVAGEDNIQSFGPIEDAPFRMSHDPTLYDLFDDSYNEPVPTKMDRAISLPAEFKAAPETRMAKSQRAAKEFSTHRNSSPAGQKRKVENLASEALFYVKGRVPVHLRHETFDWFDGVKWTPVGPEDEAVAVPRQRTLSMTERGGKPWLTWDAPLGGLECFAPAEAHAVKIVHLQTNRLPTPLHLRGVHLDQLKDPTFFRWDTDDLLAMNRDQLPELTAIHYRSQLPIERRLRDVIYWGRSFSASYRVVPEGPGMEQIARMAREWTFGHQRGWPQIEALVDRLHREYRHDPQAIPPEDCAFPVLHFLTESKAGPDYLFASAAAVMLRSLGYSTRLVGGFYASADRFDVRRGHTPVLTGDTHVWVEVYQQGQNWFTVEPTPGYAVRQPPLTTWEQVQQAARQFWLAMVRRWWWWLLLSGVAVGLWSKRRWLRDRWAGGAYWLAARCAPPANDRQRILRLVQWLDQRHRAWDQPRPAGISPGRWYRGLPSLSETDRETLADLGRWANWAAFAPLEPTVAQPMSTEAQRATVPAEAARRTARQPTPPQPLDWQRWEQVIGSLRLPHLLPKADSSHDEARRGIVDRRQRLEPLSTAHITERRSTTTAVGRSSPSTLVHDHSHDHDHNCGHDHDSASQPLQPGGVRTRAPLREVIDLSRR